MDDLSLQTWLEMKKVRRRNIAEAVWIPLRSQEVIEEQGQYGYEGFKEEYYGVGSVAVPVNQREETDSIEWTDLGNSRQHGPLWFSDGYVPSDSFIDYEIEGLHLVLEQRICAGEQLEWHLNQDLVIGLHLKREGDVWVSPKEGYQEIARLIRGENEEPAKLEIRSEHLKDYMCARDMGLYLTTFRVRKAVVADVCDIDWPEEHQDTTKGQGYWEGNIREIHEGGQPYGESMAVFRAFRTDVDPEVDVPSFELNDDNDIASESYKIKYEGRKLYYVLGELWKNEWVEPASTSPRIRGDKAQSTVSFITDTAGERECRGTLEHGRRWLWFNPKVMMELSHRRGGSLGWYTRETGCVSCSPESGVHFGVNQLGLINVFAKDIAFLAEWQQWVWAGHNVGPDGGVSEELLASQMRAKPADTQAPEAYLLSGLEELQCISLERYGKGIMRLHNDTPEIASRSHRFRSVEMSGLLALAKDLARLTVDNLDVSVMRGVAESVECKNLGSLKLLEHLLSENIGDNKAKYLMSPLFGIYELRNADSHLPASELTESFQKVGIDSESPWVQQGYQIINSCVSCIYEIINIMKDDTVKGNKKR